jgi:nicotinamidase-related amidase
MPETALIVIDMLNPYDHEDAEPLAESDRESLPRIVELRDRAEDQPDVLLVYVNDNQDAWEKDRNGLVKSALEGKQPHLVEPILPPEGVPFVPKGRHSIFYETAVAHLLNVHEVKRLVLCGQVTEQCILYSALDAYIRGYDLVVPEDAVASIDADLGRAAVRMMETNMHAEIVSAGDRKVFG